MQGFQRAFPLSLSKINSQTLVKMVRTDFNQYYTTAMGKSVQCELNSTLTCSQVTQHFKEKKWKLGGGKYGFCRVEEVKNYKWEKGMMVYVKPIWVC